MILRVRSSIEGFDHCVADDAESEWVTLMIHHDADGERSRSPDILLLL